MEDIMWLLLILSSVLLSPPDDVDLAWNSNEMPLAAQFEEADRVVIARLGRRRQCTAPDSHSYPCVELHVELTLKGAPRADHDTLYVILSGGLSDTSIDDICIRGRAVFFLAGSNGVFDPVQGPSSVLVIDEWPYSRHPPRARQASSSTSVPTAVVAVSCPKLLALFSGEALPEYPCLLAYRRWHH